MGGRTNAAALAARYDRKQRYPNKECVAIDCFPMSIKAAKAGSGYLFMVRTSKPDFMLPLFDEVDPNRAAFA